MSLAKLNHLCLKINKTP